MENVFLVFSVRLLIWAVACFLSARSGYGVGFSQSDPLLQVVSEAGPQHLHLHFHEAAHVKLSEAQLAFDPCVTKLGHSSAAAVTGPRWLRGHLLPERQHCSALFQSQNSPAATAIFRTTLWLADAGLAILGPGQVAAGN
jgi:hypothetical protein